MKPGGRTDLVDLLHRLLVWPFLLRSPVQFISHLSKAKGFLPCPTRSRAVYLFNKPNLEPSNKGICFPSLLRVVAQGMRSYVEYPTWC